MTNRNNIWYHSESQSLKISTNLNHFKCLSRSQFSIDFVQTLDSTSQLIPQLQKSKSQIISSTSNAYISVNYIQFCSNFGFYISRPILTKYIIPHQISINPKTSNLNKSQPIQMLNLSQFSSNFVQTLDFTSQDQS